MPLQPMFDSFAHPDERQLLRVTGLLSFDVFLTVHHSIDFSKYQLSAQFF